MHPSAQMTGGQTTTPDRADRSRPQYTNGRASTHCLTVDRLPGTHVAALVARLEVARDIVVKAAPRGLDPRTTEERVRPMFDFLRRSAPRPPSTALAHA